ncbi:iron-containing alcohol dehydrogenase [bacterium]|nr:iron-containing alcohol dehydrogenase [bacterium]
MTASFMTHTIDISPADAMCDAWLPAKSRLLVVSDANCLQAVGEGVIKSLRSHADVVLLNFSASPQADALSLERVKHALADRTHCLAIGSGTINDLCKLASAQAGIPYAVLPTAPSMNGYLSANASINLHGHKQSFAAHVPHALLLNWQILAEAPQRLAASGFADSLCRSTCWRDWQLSHLLLDTPFDAAMMERLKTHEQAVIHQMEGLQRQSPEAVRALMEWLLEGGRAMTSANSSAPASQGEHMLAHWLELRGYGKSLLHGELIAVTTLIMAELQEKLLESPPRLEWRKPPMEALHHALGQAQAKECLDSAAHKPIGSSRRAAAWMKQWPRAAAAIHGTGHAHSRRKLQGWLQGMGLQTSPRSAHIPQKEIHLALKLAALSRDRFTFLDIAMFAAMQE